MTFWSRVHFGMESPTWTAMPGIRVSGYPTETVITRFHFSVPSTPVPFFGSKYPVPITRLQLPVNDLNILTEHVSVRILGMLRVVFGREIITVTNLLIMALIKQENIVFVLVILLCVFTKLFMGITP